MTIALINFELLLKEISQQPGKFTVIDARPEAEYLQGHIPGALRMPWEEWCQSAPAEAAAILHQPGYWGTLADAIDQDFEKRLVEAGIKVDCPIVVYADSARSKGREGRVAWMLLYLGAEQVYLLDGGWQSWLNCGGAVESGSHQPVNKGQFRITLDKRRRAEHQQVSESLASGVDMPLMIDTRTEAEFNGDCYDYQPLKGRLPNSVLFPFAAIFNDDGTFINRERYLAIAPTDIFKSSVRISYCEVGVRASTFSLLHEIYTGEIIPVYDGSIIEWGWLQKKL